MATVLSWPPQSAGADIACAGWPGSNGSVIGTNVTAVDGAVAVAAVPAGLAVAGALCTGALCVGALPVVLAAVAVALRVAPPAAGPPEPPHPASTPTATADMAPSAIPPLTALLPPKVTGRPPRD
jgi:hypothetical protein